MASSVPAYISYNLYQDSAHAVPWNSTTGLLTGTGSAVPLTFMAWYLRQAPPQRPRDTVTMTVTW